MPGVKDPAIKLFGKTIQLSHVHDVGEIKATIQIEHEHKHEHDTISDQSTSLAINDDPKTPNSDKETPTKNTPIKDNPISDPNPEDKPQKPDKILPCPRCNSMDTKFCYYNNYNVNQPRHFCKNCQRYWTAGGTMRNTPIGSGRRKNKSLSSGSYYRHLIVTDGLKNNGSVLNFGSECSDVRLCESMNQALNFSDRSMKFEDDSSSSVSNLVENGGNNGKLPNYPVRVQIPCFPSSPWCYPPSNFYNLGCPVNLYQTTPQYWGCTVQVQPGQQGPWNLPMPVTLVNPNSPLGKHSRDGNLLPPSLNFGNGSNSINGGILSKAFKSKIDEKNEVVGSSLANLQANPAALSRSLNFRETS